jgi:hypothetical protein
LQQLTQPLSFEQLPLSILLARIGLQRRTGQKDRYDIAGNDRWAQDAAIARPGHL